ELRFRRVEGTTDAIVSEPNRDVRKAPYSGERGTPRTRVIDDFLVMRDMPVVAVALEARGTLEGFAFLCGPKARDAFSKEPKRAQRVARDLGALLRQRRMERTKAATEDAQSQDEADPTLAVTRLIDGARTRLDLMTLAVREAPDALLYADAFGDV